MKATQNNRCIDLYRIGRWIALLLFVKVLVSILYQYRWYFPADFEEAAFLIGRRDYFFGAYSIAFYLHIVCGPIALVNAAFLMFSGSRPSGQKLHRLLGRAQIVLVSLVATSGVWMARHAFAGPVAGVGFLGLATFTLGTVTAATYYAVKRQFAAHRRWATRCFILLCSPMLLRVIAGAAIVLQLESMTIYRLNAWFSWLLPLAIYEVVLLFRSGRPRIGFAPSFFRRFCIGGEQRQPSFHGKLRDR